MAFVSTHCHLHVCAKKLTLQLLLLLLWGFIGLIYMVRATKHVHLPNANDIIKTVRTQYGDIFDCVDIYKQPAFSNPLLKDHKLQMRPTSFPKEMFNEEFPEITSPILLEDEGCPEGTIPVHKLPNNTSHSYVGHDAGILSNFSASGNYRRMSALTRTNDWLTWHGGVSAINVYAIPDVKRGQSSTSYMGLYNFNSGGGGGGISAGWTVYPNHFGDAETRLFVAYTTNFKKTCYNLDCSGFVQVNKGIYLGTVVRPLSTYKGQQYELRLYMSKDNTTGDWWVSIIDPSNYIGYWPNSLFRSFEYATRMQFGGEVVCNYGEACPAMGNGHLPVDYPYSCFFRNLRYLSNDGSFQMLAKNQLYTTATTPVCYKVGQYHESFLGFYFGGPGC